MVEVVLYSADSAAEDKHGLVIAGYLTHLRHNDF
jgi:hypothetical protein